MITSNEALDKGSKVFWTISPISDWGKKEKVVMNSGTQEKTKQSVKYSLRTRWLLTAPIVLKLKVKSEDCEEISLIHQEESDLAFCGGGAL